MKMGEIVMKQKYFYAAIRFLFVMAICELSVNAQDSDAYLSSILQAVQKNIDLQKEQIIDFFSNEEITIEQFNEKMKLVTTTSVISDYRAFPKIANSISDCRIVSEILTSIQPDIIQEEREILSIKRNNRNVKEFTEAIWAKGNTYTDIFILFDKQNEKCFDYKLLGAGKIGERSVFAIEIKQKNTDTGRNDINGAVENDSGIRTMNGSYESKMTGISWEMRYEGVALIDAGTMEIVQLSRDAIDYILTYKMPSTHPLTKETTYRVLKEEKYILLIQYEYDKVKIRDQFLTLPVTRIVKLSREDGQLDTVYTYKYSNHKAFGSNTTIRFNEIEEFSDQIEN
jgi:hypothetical protein